MGYQAVTWGELKDTFFHRLQNSNFWTDDDVSVDTPNVLYPEASLYLREALYVWGTLTYYWRERITFNTIPDQRWYDLRSIKPEFFGSSLTERDLIAEMQHHLLEPVSPTGGVGTGQFPNILSRFQAALLRRRDQFLKEAGTQLDHEIILNATIGGNGRYELDSSVIDIRRLSWQAPEDNPDNILLEDGFDILQEDGSSLLLLEGVALTNLYREDESSLTGLLSNWNLSKSKPRMFSTTASPPLRVQFAPPPNRIGDLDLVSIKTGPLLNFNTGVALGIPDSYAHVIKWGALADILSVEGEGRDPMRAQYCDFRYKVGVASARNQPSIVHAEINGVPTRVVPLFDLDRTVSGWENTPRGRSKVIATAGLNLIALHPIPDGVHSITLDVVRPSPIPLIPISKGDFVEIGSEEITAIVDYAHHIAAFKQGGLEFQMAGRLYQSFIDQASVHNERLRGGSVFGIPMFGQAQEDEKRELRRDDVEVDALNA